MQKAEIKIEPYRDEFRNQIVSTWEKSVRATHDFVKPADIEYFKEIVEKIDFSSFPVYCLTYNNVVIGFIGVAEFKIETLFRSGFYRSGIW
jgi:putative acetyltransferase